MLGSLVWHNTEGFLACHFHMACLSTVGQTWNLFTGCSRSSSFVTFLFLCWNLIFFICLKWIHNSLLIILWWFLWNTCQIILIHNSCHYYTGWLSFLIYRIIFCFVFPKDYEVRLSWVHCAIFMPEEFCCVVSTVQIAFLVTLCIERAKEFLPRWCQDQNPYN
jgi:hypothetical protein